MRAIIAKQPGGAEQLQVIDQPKPDPKAEELLDKVKAISINRTDIINRESTSDYVDHQMLGIEFTSVVEKAGSGTNIQTDQPIMGLVNGGEYAEYAVMPADRAMPNTENLSFEQAVAIPEISLTAYQTLFWHGNLK